jgi:4-hydroxy-3-methylbut-2-enyl diphosphate reductase
MVVIGSANSSNTLALGRTARSAGCPRVLRVNRASELPDDLSGTVGVIAGASAPESLVEEVLRHLSPAKGTEEVQAVTEDEYFPLPRELREVLRSVAGGLSGAASAPLHPDAAERVGHDGASFDGRDVSAAEVLAALG